MIRQLMPMPTPKKNDFDKTIEALFADGDINGLHALCGNLAQENFDIEKRNTQLVERCDVAEEDVRNKNAYIKELTRLLYGRRTEKLNKEELHQLCLALGGTEEDCADNPTVPRPDESGIEEEEAPQDEKRGRRKKRPNHKGRGKLSEELERIVTQINVPAEDRDCKGCGQPMQGIGHVEHETVEHIPERFVVHVESREKIACKGCGCGITTAPRTNSDGETRAGVSVLATVLDGKGEDALPVERQADRFKRLGWDIPYNTLLGYWSHAADLLEPIADVTVSKILDDYVVALDDTGFNVTGNHKGDKKYRAHLWCITNTGPLTGFRFTKTWRHQDIAPWIDVIPNFIQVDDYKGYSAIVKYADGLFGPLIPRCKRLGCMMHVRRGFHAAFILKDNRAAKPVALIREIYKIEKFAKDHEFDPDERLALRREKSVPLLKQLYDYLENQQDDIGRTSKYARAVRYAIAQKEFIERCFTDGRFEIDNGKTEREIRRPAVGRKNYLHVGSADGGKRLATVYTLILSCRNLGIDTREYLIDVLGKIRNQWPLARLSELIPDNWARARGLID